jgi:hypothetical protein
VHEQRQIVETFVGSMLHESIVNGFQALRRVTEDGKHGMMPPEAQRIEFYSWPVQL